MLVLGDNHQLVGILTRKNFKLLDSGRYDVGRHTDVSMTMVQDDSDDELIELQQTPTPSTRVGSTIAPCLSSVAPDSSRLDWSPGQETFSFPGRLEGRPWHDSSEDDLDSLGEPVVATEGEVDTVPLVASRDADSPL